MVHSIINKEIIYDEISSIFKQDKQYEASMWSINLYNHILTIAIGKLNSDFEADNIYFYPIYLKDKKNTFKCIGLYEIDANTNLKNLLDKDNDIDIHKLGKPLLYDNFKLLNLTDYEYSKADEKEADEKEVDEKEDDEKEDDEKEDDIFEINKTVIKPQPLKEQTKEDADKEREKQVDGDWISIFMKNKNYKVKEEGSGGDCFFYVIVSAFKYIGKETSIFKLRHLLASKATEEIYLNYKELYNNFNNEKIDLEKKAKLCRKELKQLKKESSLQNIKMINEKTEECSKLNDLLQDNQLALNEFKFVEKVNNLKEFRDVIKTSNYWADTWAISTLERLLNVKFVIFSEHLYNDKAKDHVLQCGQLNDTEIEEKGSFNPEYYILVNHISIHYQLITYKDHKIFTFKELPYDVKHKIIDKCLEKNSGPYYLIPEFKQLKDQTISKPKETSMSSDKSESLTPNLYDDSTIIFFYDKAPLTSKIGAWLPEKKYNLSKVKGEFVKLEKISGWRRMLDNKYTSPFNLDNKQWKTVEHYVYAHKFKSLPELFNYFTLDSDSELSKDIKLIKKVVDIYKKNKKIKEEGFLPKLYHGKRIPKVQELSDKDKKSILYNGLYAKFNIDEFKHVLKLTKKAKLMYFIPKNEPIEATILMKVRDNLSTS